MSVVSDMLNFRSHNNFWKNKQITEFNFGYALKDGSYHGTNTLNGIYLNNTEYSGVVLPDENNIFILRLVARHTYSFPH